MTTTMRPHGPGSRRAVPAHPTDEQRDALREWLQGDEWVLRLVWERWLDTREERFKTPLDRLTRSHLAAARAWLRQQRHALHEALEGGMAPDGWLESQPLYRALTGRLDTDPRI